MKSRKMLRLGMHLVKHGGLSPPFILASLLNLPSTINYSFYNINYKMHKSYFFNYKRKEPVTRKMFKVAVKGYKEL